MQPYSCKSHPGVHSSSPAVSLATWILPFSSDVPNVHAVVCVYDQEEFDVLQALPLVLKSMLYTVHVESWK